MIKKTISIIAVASFLLTISCKKDADVVPQEGITKVDPNGKFASMDFDKKEHDFGTIDEGDKE